MKTINNHFKIIIPFFNIEEWAKRCVLSVKLQNYKNFECILVDDISTDNSTEIVKKIIRGDERFTLIENKEKKYALQNIYDAIEYSQPDEEDVIVTLDGDDWFSSGRVLETLNKTYNQKGCWLTYGSYVEHPSKNRGKFSRKIPDDVIEKSSFREREWTSSHLRSFKHFLWKNIKKEDLLDDDGEFYRMAWDLSFMFPMLEMSLQKSHFIDNILYVYNLSNPINDHKVDNGLQIKTEQKIRQKNKYERLVR